MSFALRRCLPNIGTKRFLRNAIGTDALALTLDRLGEVRACAATVPAGRDLPQVIGARVGGRGQRLAPLGVRDEVE